ncbi:MAG: HTH domain-containing protein [Acidobacteria bacterium]|nr:HTH domain-containing protein [Acidobacteriota bacterium]
MHEAKTRNSRSRMPSCGLLLELFPEFNTIKTVQPRTKRQKEVLDYVTRFIDRNGHRPSYQQIARHLGVSSRAGVQRHIAALESQGLISRRRENGSFGIELQLQKIATDKVCDVDLIETDDGSQGRPGDMVRTAAAVPRYLIGDLAPDEVFAFRAPDDSLIGRQICERDVILFARRSYARRGEVVVAQTDDGRMLLGLYFQRGRETEIRPACEGYEPVTLPADEVTVEGVMLGLMRFASMSDDR